MQHTVHDFLHHEIEEIQKNIDRICNHTDNKYETLAYSSQNTILKLQQDYLILIEELLEQVYTCNDLVSICRQNILYNEIRHSQIGYRENATHVPHSTEWWATLHLIQFWCDLLCRMRNFQERHQLIDNLTI